MFSKSLPLTLGVEEEYQIINPETRELHAYISELLAQDEQREQKVHLKPEFMQSQVEVGSPVCRNVEEVRQELTRLRHSVSGMAEENGLAIAAASTHPFSRWQEQSISDGARYKELLDDMQGVARSMLIFGMHVHVGFGHKENPENRELMIEIMNQARTFLPYLLALSTSSPFWQGQYTGLRSYRSVLFEQLPRTGIPPSFDSWHAYESYERVMGKVGAFGRQETTAKIWWDIRPHPVYDTLEFRIADICTRIEEAVCLAALVQAICAKLIKLHQQNMSWRHYRHMLITENKWRAVRYGIDGCLVDFGREAEMPAPILINELLAFVDDVLDDLGSREAVNYVHTILREGTSANRQMRVYRQHGGDANREAALHAVVDSLIRETVPDTHARLSDDSLYERTISDNKEIKNGYNQSISKRSFTIGPARF